MSPLHSADTLHWSLGDFIRKAGYLCVCLASSKGQSVVREVNTRLSGPGFQSACQIHNIIHTMCYKQAHHPLRVIPSPTYDTHCWMQAVVSSVNRCVSDPLPHLLYMLIKCLRLALNEGEVCRSCAT